MSQTCPSCKQPASGRFCASCGVAIEADCRECGSHLPPGARFCNSCGAPAAPAEPAPAEPPARSGSPLPWVVAGVALVALAAVVLVPRLQEGESAVAPTAAAPVAGAPGVGAPAAGAGPAGVDLASMTPREAADRLFNRVMQNVSSGDTVQATTFLPMAISAYQQIPELDTDGHYHLAVLHLVGGNAQAARAEANAILSRDPQHLFGLFTAAQSEQTMGNEARARELYERFLAAYDTEIQRQLPEYQHHQQALGPMRQEAERAVGTE